MNLTKAIMILLLCAVSPTLAATNAGLFYKQKITKLNVMPNGNSGGRIESFYDSRTNLIEEHKFDSSGSILEKIEYGYDENNNRIRSVFYNCFGWLCSKEEYSYDGRGNVISESQYFNGNLLDQTVNPAKKSTKKVSTNVTFNNRIAHSYDKTGNRIKSVKFDCNGDVCYIDQLTYTNSDKIAVQSRSLGKKTLSRTEFKYDSSGFKIEEISYSSNDSDFQKKIFVNNKNGDMTKQMTYDLDGNLTETKIFSYDGNRNIIGMTAYDFKMQKTGNIVKIYDQNRLCVEMDEYNSAGEPVRKQLWQYDNRGNIVHDVVYLFKNEAPILIQDIEYSYIY